MNEIQIAEVLTGIVGNPTVQLIAALLALGLVPTRLLTRVPLFGPLLSAALESWAKQQVLNFDATRAVQEAEAARIVRAKEQDIKNGRVDQASAKAQATLELQQAFALPVHEAARLIESEVNLLPKMGVLAYATAASAGELN